MASLPARQPSQRRVSPSEQTSNAQSQQAQSSPSPVRTRSEDSQTLFLNKPDSPQDQGTSEPQPHESASPAADDASVKKCWICFSDSTEDTPETSPWRSPCPCALVAHEECLLDWIADMELPTNIRKKDSNGIQCPQCKSEIKLARPRNYVVDAVRRLEKAGTDLIYPGAGTVLFATLYNASMAWGMHSVYAVFGADDGFRILRPLIYNRVRPPLEVHTARDIGTNMLALAVDHVVHWRVFIGVPLITPLVILSRTTYADSLLPVLPILFFATQTTSGTEPLDFNTWPPSAGLAFSVLPYLRIVYNAYYRRVWEPKEKQWLREIQPRARDQAATDADGNALPANVDPDDEPLIEVRLDMEDWDSDEEEEEEEVNELIAEAEANERAAQEGDAPNANPAPGGQEEGQQEGREREQPQDNDAPPNPQPVIANGQGQAANPPAGAPAAGGAAGAQRREPGAAIRVTPLIEACLGALLFPTIASISGELLKLALPHSWTAGPGFSSRGARIAAKGLLQEKWGRSLVGGCLFVVFKDAVMLYVRWKMAQMHRKRRVLNFEGKRVGEGVKA